MRGYKLYWEKGEELPVASIITTHPTWIKKSLLLLPYATDDALPSTAASRVIGHNYRFSCQATGIDAELR